MNIVESSGRTCSKILGIMLAFSQVLIHPVPVKAQAENFDVFTYQPPAFFLKTPVNQGIQFTVENNDTSFCSIRLYKKQHGRKNLKSTIIRQWNSVVCTGLAQVDLKPSKIMTGEKLDGWKFALSIGNFYHNKKKGIVMLYTFRRGGESACAVFVFSDKIFKTPVEEFSKNLHLVKGE